MALSKGRLFGVSVIFIFCCNTPVLANFNESEDLNQTDVHTHTWKFPLTNIHMEEEGIYTGVQVPGMFTVFRIEWKGVLTCEEHNGENVHGGVHEIGDYIAQRKRRSVQLGCARRDHLLRGETPITVITMNDTAVCHDSNAIIYGTKDLHNILSAEKRFMALWTFRVPAETCIQIFFKTYNVLSLNKLYIKTGEWVDNIASSTRRRRFVYERLALNASVISIAYSHVLHTEEDPVIQFTLRLSSLQCRCPAH